MLRKTAVPTGILICFSKSQSIQHVSLGVNTVHGHLLFVHISLRASYRPMVRSSDPGRRFHQFDKVPQGVTLIVLRGSCVLATKEPSGQVPTPNCLFGLFLVSHSNCLSPRGNRRRANVSKPELGLGHGAGEKGRAGEK